MLEVMPKFKSNNCTSFNNLSDFEVNLIYEVEFSLLKLTVPSDVNNPCKNPITASLFAVKIDFGTVLYCASTCLTPNL